MLTRMVVVSPLPFLGLVHREVIYIKERRTATKAENEMLISFFETPYFFADDLV